MPRVLLTMIYLIALMNYNHSGDVGPSKEIVHDIQYKWIQSDVHTNVFICDLRLPPKEGGYVGLTAEE